MQAVLEAAHAGQPARLRAGDLAHPGTDYVYAADAAQGAVRACLAERMPSRVYNISLGRTNSLQAILAVVEAAVGRSVSLDVEEAETFSGYGGVTHALDSRRARDDLGYVPQYPLEAAIRDYLVWLAR